MRNSVRRKKTGDLRRNFKAGKSTKMSWEEKKRRIYENERSKRREKS